MLAEAGTLALVSLAAVALFTGSFHLTTRDAWTTPLAFSGDALFVEAAMVTCADGACLTGAPTPRLGAPLAANWADFPRTEDLLSFLGGQLAVHLGLGLATNVLLLLGALGAVWAMYGCARWLRVRRPVALIAGLLFAFSPYFFTRNVQHLSLSFYALTPVAVLAWRQLAQGGRWRRGRRWFLACTALALGLQAVYYALYFIMGCALVAALQAVRRRWSAVRWAVACCALTVAAMALMSVDTLRLVAREGFNPRAVVRHAGEGRAFGLWPEQLVLPSTFHRLAPVRALVEPYAARWGGRGEYPSAYLGLAGAVSLAALLVVGARRRSMTMGLVTFWFAMALPVGVLALVGRATGVALLRSNNRVSVVLLAIALLWGAHRVSRWARTRTRRLAAAALGCLALVEQVPLTDADVDPDFQARLTRTWEATGALASRLEGAQVFVFPAQSFPEAAAPPFGDPYLPLQLVLRSRTARISFGGVRGRPAGDVPTQLATLPPDALVAALRRSGYTALATHRAACDAACRGRLVAAVATMRDVALHEVPGTDWLAWTWRDD